MNDIAIGQLFLGLCVGISLSAACGFRVFTPLLVVSIAVHFFGATVNPNFQWIGSWLALVILGTATFVEILSYYIPWVDNVLDAINTPLALAAGAVVMSGMLPDLHPGLRWSIALIVGTGAAGITQAATAIIRGTSTATTGGVGNSMISSSENVGAASLAVMAFVVPIVASFVGVVIIVVMLLVAKNMMRRMRSSNGSR